MQVMSVFIEMICVSFIKLMPINISFSCVLLFPERIQLLASILGEVYHPHHYHREKKLIDLFFEKYLAL